MNNKQRKNLTAPVAATLVFVAMLALPVGADPILPSDEDKCKATDYGVQYEYPDCGIDCNLGDQLSIEVTQTYHDYVSGDAECGGATTSCIDWDGRCGQDGSLAIDNSVVGECHGEAYLRDAGLGRVTVRCYTRADVTFGVNTPGEEGGPYLPGISDDEGSPSESGGGAVNGGGDESATQTAAAPTCESAVAHIDASVAWLTSMTVETTALGTLASGYVMKGGECFEFVPVLSISQVVGQGTPTTLIKFANVE